MKIMQCWDDSVATDAPLADLFRNYDAKATFNIIPPWRAKNWLYNETFKVEKLTLDEMKAAYQGFKVAAHGGARMSTLPPEILKLELDECKELIRKSFGQEKCGLAYPGGDYNDAIKRAARDAGFLYGRSTKNIDGLLPLDDPMELHSHCHFLSPEFWAKYEKIRELDGVFYFWGHSYELMADIELWGELEYKLAKISGDPKAEWIDVIDLFA